jgi:hypothetical protein
VFHGDTEDNSKPFFFVRSSRNDTERVIRQRPLQRLGLVPWRVHRARGYGLLALLILMAAGLSDEDPPMGLRFLTGLATLQKRLLIGGEGGAGGSLYPKY